MKQLNRQNPRYMLLFSKHWSQMCAGFGQQWPIVACVFVIYMKYILYSATTIPFVTSFRTQMNSIFVHNLFCMYEVCSRSVSQHDSYMFDCAMFVVAVLIIYAYPAGAAVQVSNVVQLWIWRFDNNFRVCLINNRYINYVYRHTILFDTIKYLLSLLTHFCNIESDTKIQQLKIYI